MIGSYIKLGVAALFPVIASAILFILDKKTSFSKLNKRLKQLIYGLVFGGLAVVGNEWAIPFNDAAANCRDASVLTAGLLFGWESGLIAGVIGGVERWFAVLWGASTFTRVACTVSTILAGVYAAFLRRVMFENKRPGWLIAFAIGVVMEVFHLTMVFITNMSATERAMKTVKDCAIPMILANGLSVMFSSVVLSVLTHEKVIGEKEKTHISQTIQRWLLIAVAVAFVLTTSFVYSMQDKLAITQRDDTLTISVIEVQKDINGTETDIIDKVIIGITKNRHVGKDGFIVVFNNEYELVSEPENVNGDSLILSIQSLTKIPNEFETFEMSVDDVDYYCLYGLSGDYYILSLYSKTEALQMRNIALYVNTFMEILVFALLFFLIYMLIKKVVVNRMKSINVSLGKIANGNLNEVVDVRTNEEFASLSRDINVTVDTLKRYIDEASKRIDKELEFAKNIQESALPSVFPAFPNRRDFDVYAYMDTAKEVGGDFYDFYLTHKGTFNFLIADVSGKGIPAAMFMMRAKTELKSLTESDLQIEKVFNKGNNALCEGNDAGMFVTAWQGKLDLNNGELNYVNAGHNPPLIKRANGNFEFIKGKGGFVLAGLNDYNYKMQELKLNKGDVIFLYTDGVTEATDEDNNLYGENRLLNILNAKEYKDVRSMCEAVKTDIDSFVGDAEQFDDITMLALKYNGCFEKINESAEFNADVDELDLFLNFLDEKLKRLNCSKKVITQLNVASEEIFVNVAHYAYKEKKGKIKVDFVSEYGLLNLSFRDSGIKFNPLEKENPDITLSAEDRNIGGLGIYMVKKTMDDVTYKNENGENILTIIKDLTI